MLQAWIVLPALYIAYLMAAPALSVARRYRNVAISALVALAVSISWMCVVTLVPAHDRPYVDGSCNNSVFSQVFLYNGADRLSGNVLDQPGCSPPPAAVASQTSTTGGADDRARERPGALPGRPARALTPPGSSSRPSSRSGPSSSHADAGRAPTRGGRPPSCGAPGWCSWAFFADSKFLNDYYLAASRLRWPRSSAWGSCWRGVCATSPGPCPSSSGATVLAAVAESLYLNRAAPASGRGSSSPRRPRRRGGRVHRPVAARRPATAVGRPRRPRPRRGRAALGAAWASGTAVASRLGPFDTPYQAASATSDGAVGWQHDMARWTSQASAAATVPVERSIETAETSASQSGRAGDGSRVPPRRWVQRTGAEHAAPHVRPMGARGAHPRHARRHTSADTEPGHAVGPGARCAPTRPPRSAKAGPTGPSSAPPPTPGPEP